MNTELIKRILSSIIILPLVIFVIIKGSYYFNMLLLLFFFISIFEWSKMTKNKRYYLLGIFFLALSFFTIYKLRNDFSGEYIYLLFVTTICVATDLGGFLFGKLIKGPKLTKISPNKTYSGMLGSFVLSILGVYVFIIMFNKDFLLINFEIILFSIIVSAVSQLGDIIISYFKRVSKVKDTGNIIPGHGGVLDRIDGMIFAYPFSYLIILLTNIKIFS